MFSLYGLEVKTNAKAHFQDLASITGQDRVAFAKANAGFLLNFNLTSAVIHANGVQGNITAKHMTNFAPVVRFRVPNDHSFYDYFVVIAGKDIRKHGVFSGDVFYGTIHNETHLSLFSKPTQTLEHCLDQLYLAMIQENQEASESMNLNKQLTEQKALASFNQ